LLVSKWYTLPLVVAHARSATSSLRRPIVLKLTTARRVATGALLTALSGQVGCQSVPERATPLPWSVNADMESSLANLMPSNNRDWSPDLAVLAYAEIDGNEVKIRNIRNCTYRADNEYVIKHYDRKFDLDKIRTVDFIVVPFKEAEGLAHTMMSFGFEGDKYVCVSVEARLEKGETYSPLLGSLRQLELMYVVADERDVILRRTFHRGVDVYLYQTKATPEQARQLFLDVVQRVNKLYREPEFYDTLTNNCTTSLKPFSIPLWDPRVVLPGYSDRLAFELGWLDTTRSFEELKSAARITDRANAVAEGEDFSRAIRR
jgi:hypothetical protein